MGQGGQGHSSGSCAGVRLIRAGSSLEPVLETGGLSGDLGLFHSLLVEASTVSGIGAAGHCFYHMGAGAFAEQAAPAPPKMNEKRQLSSCGAEADFVSCKILKKHPEGFDREAAVDYNRK